MLEVRTEFEVEETMSRREVHTNSRRTAAPWQICANVLTACLAFFEENFGKVRGKVEESERNVINIEREATKN